MIVTSLIVGSPAAAQEQKTTRPTVGEAHQGMSLTPAELTWTAGPPMLPPGASMALIEGGPNQPGPFRKVLPAGSLFEMPATIHHFGWAGEATTIQHHGVGPFNMQYLNPADDPRQK